MLFGTAPFEATNNTQLLKAIEKGYREKNSKEVRLSKEVKVLLKAMLQTEPSLRVGMNGMLDMLSAYTINQKAMTLHHYKQMSLKGLSGIGAIGSMIAALGFQPTSYIPSPKSMDLRLYGKLCSCLTVAASS